MRNKVKQHKKICLVRLTTQTSVNTASHARTHSTTPCLCAHTRAQYSKRWHGLINNASPLHVYAIYRARPSDGYCMWKPGAQ